MDIYMKITRFPSVKNERKIRFIIIKTTVGVSTDMVLQNYIFFFR